MPHSALNIIESTTSREIMLSAEKVGEEVRTNRFQTKWLNVGWHIAAWLVIFSLPYFLRLTYSENRIKDPDADGFFYLNLNSGLFWTATFYLNAYVLIPKLVYKKKYLWYALVMAVLFLLLINLHGLLFVELIKTHQFNFVFSAIYNAPAYLLAVAASTIFQLVKDKINTTRLAQQKQEENLKTELSFLRSQISPHFIFNVLNNIVALARLKSDQLEPTVIKLSSLMQYMLYDTNEDRVLLKTETEYLETYIDLQQQRFGGKVKINVDIQCTRDFYEIEPMLLIPFVENAFKHGVGIIENPEINIRLFIKNNTLYFNTSNKFNNTVPEVKDKASGIGLNNVKRRLNLLYHNQHQIDINTRVTEQNECWFDVSLQLKLH